MTKTKKNKTNKLSNLFNTGPKKLLVFVLAFAVIGGGVYAYKSFARENKYGCPTKRYAHGIVHAQLSRGSTNTACVKHLQELLNKKLGGDNLTIDGDFGELTEQKVKIFQRSRALTVDGIVGNNTWFRLDNLPEG